MRVDIYHHLPTDLAFDRKLDSLIEAVTTLIGKIEAMSKELDRLSGEVTEATGVMISAKTLIEGLAEKIRGLANDPAAITALADSLDNEANSLAAAVAANTQAPEEPPLPTE